MAYIAPNSTVILLKNIPLEPNFENTVWYNNESEQEQDFLQQSYSPRTFTAQSYVHKERGVIRLAAQISQVYDCNYMMFKNTSFENKWFYAFVTRVEYVSNEVTEIYFTIDPIQTWLKRFTVDDSFIAREHTYTDKPTDWLIPENIDAGPYIYYGEESLFGENDYSYVIVAPFMITWSGSGEQFNVTISNYSTVVEVGGMPSGLHYTIINDILTLAAVLNRLATTVKTHEGATANAISEVVTVMVAPSRLFNVDGSIESWDYSTAIPVQRERIPARTSLDTTGGQDYVFKNQKLNAYPYRYFLATDFIGNTAMYKPELFANSEDWVTFLCVGDVTPKPSVYLFPKNYSGNTDRAFSPQDKNNMAIYSGFLTIAWTVDVWKQWLASTGVENAVDKTKEWLANFGQLININQKTTDLWATYQPEDKTDLKNPIKYWTNFLDKWKEARIQDTENRVDKFAKIIGGGMVLAGTLAHLSQYYQQSLKPNTVMGTQSGGARLFMGMANCTIFEYGITRERAEIIDRFFTAYGYATNRFGKPYLFSDTSKARPYINYVQTNGANVNGSLPKDSADAIAAIFDGGVRFWTAQPSGGHPSPLANVNNYSALENLNSPPVG